RPAHASARIGGGARRRSSGDKRHSRWRLGSSPGGRWALGVRQRPRALSDGRRRADQGAVIGLASVVSLSRSRRCRRLPHPRRRIDRGVWPRGLRRMKRAPQFSLRLSRWHEWLVYSTSALLLVTGIAWLLLDRLGKVDGEFGPEPSPALPWLLLV